MKSKNDFRKAWPIEAEWRIYASVNYAINGSDNGLFSVQFQAIDWNNADTFLVGKLIMRNRFQKNFNQTS